MAWSDTWGDSPWGLHFEVAKTFYAGRPMRRSGVEVRKSGFYYELLVNGSVIARHVPERLIPDVVLRDLRGLDKYEIELRVRFSRVSKAEQRYLRALGFPADSHDLTIMGKRVDVTSTGYSFDDLCSIPDYKPPQRVPRNKFVNMTGELFA